MPARHKTTF